MGIKLPALTLLLSLSLLGCDFRQSNEIEKGQQSKIDYKLKCYALTEDEKHRYDPVGPGDFQLEWIKYSSSRESCISKWFFSNVGDDFSYQRQNYHDVLTGEQIQSLPTLEEVAQSSKDGRTVTDFTKLMKNAENFEETLGLLD